MAQAVLKMTDEFLAGAGYQGAIPVDTITLDTLISQPYRCTQKAEKHHDDHMRSHFMPSFAA
jgi:hypothetical protein